MALLSRKEKIILCIGSCIVLGGLLTVLYSYLSPTGFAARKNSELGQASTHPEASYVTLDGERVDMNDFESPLLIVNFWASWSPFTHADGEVLKALKEEYGERITIRAVNRKESVDTARAYLNTVGKAPGVEYILDTTDYLYAEGGGYAMPETVVFDRTGNEVARIRGTLTLPDLRIRIEELLGEGG